MAEYHNQSKLRFWCQMVLPLVYDDSLSYMELLNKVVDYLNNCIQDVGSCETNIESLLEAFVNLQDYVNEFSDNVGTIVEEKIDEMIESGEFGEILADALATVVAPEYDTTESYIPLNYAIYEGTLYCCTSNTTGTWDSTKWRETTVGDELNTLMQRVYGLNAGQVNYDGTATYNSGTVGKALKDVIADVDGLTANDVAYNSSEIYDDSTVGKALGDLNTAITFRPSTKVSDSTTIPDNTDYDTLTTPGDYVCATGSSAQTMTNQPSSTAAHRLYVIQSVASNRITQIALLNLSNTKLMIRTLTSIGWSSWTEPTYRVQSQLTENVETDTTATQSYSVGDFLAIKEVLYRVTSSIANGGTITPGTNVSATTVTDELKSLNSFADGLSGVQKYSFTLAANTTKTYNIGSSKYGIMFSLGITASILELLIYRTNSSGVIVHAQAFNASGLTISKTNNKLTIANTTSVATQIVFITLTTDTITETT